MTITKVVVETVKVAATAAMTTTTTLTSTSIRPTTNSRLQ
jgi:hypothetical protein